MDLTAAHWIYAVFVVIVVITMAKRRDALIPCIAGAFLVGWAVTGTPLGAVETVFRSSVVAARELLDIILIISIIGGLAACLEDIGAERLMVAPARALMKSPEVAFWVIGVVMLIASYFLWPSPATALVGAVLVPAASAVKLPLISTAVAMNIFGHGIALSTDYVIQGAPSISAKAANVPVEAVMYSQIPLIITMSIVTVTVSFIIARRDIKRAREANEVTREAVGAMPGGNITHDGPITVTDDATIPSRPTAIAGVAAVVVPLSYLAVVITLITFRIRGGEATTIIGGVSLLLVTAFTLISHGTDSFDLITEHLIKGFTFGIKIFTPVIIIASFFYLGSPDIARQVFGDGARGLLFDLAGALSNVLPLNRVTVGIMETVIGSVVGLVGSGFSGLPLTGSLAGAFASAAHVKTETLAALGQIATVWVGGGCIIPWGVIPVAAICRVSPQELAVKNFVPVIMGLVATTIVAIIVM
ncbi:transporter [soil metagenome]